ncbi:MAG: aminodeoxychorismate/anthranilate synthase component II [Bacteroidales bacterium]|nr:aminodeoxychorismate/anthranilate synthase component II [Bacteroidales bacterium]
MNGKILIIDNYDSFTYNLVHQVTELTGIRPDVFRNDDITLSRIDDYDKIILSPGPGIPSEAGICIDIIRQYAGKKKILGVCLGHQAIAEAFGAKLRNLDSVFHGLEKPVRVTDPSDYLFKGLPIVFNAGRYHSWVVEKEYLPDCLSITAVDDNDLIMAIRHREFDIRGVQFHPESIMTETGLRIMQNWIEK